MLSHFESARGARVSEGGERSVAIGAVERARQRRPTLTPARGRYLIELWTYSSSFKPQLRR